MIWKVAVPRPQHSPMLGQWASSQTVCRPPSRMISRSSPKRVLADGARTLIQLGRSRVSSDHGTGKLRELEVVDLCQVPGDRRAQVVDA